VRRRQRVGLHDPDNGVDDDLGGRVDNDAVEPDLQLAPVLLERRRFRRRVALVT
jgi:hypothetical protein